MVLSVCAVHVVLSVCAVHVVLSVCAVHVVLSLVTYHSLPLCTHVPLVSAVLSNC